MSSPNIRKSLSPKKSLRPSTTQVDAWKNLAFVNKSSSHQVNIIQELNGTIIEQQNKDIEIERLKTTCFTINQKLSTQNDLYNDISVLNKRLSESE